MRNLSEYLQKKNFSPIVDEGEEISREIDDKTVFSVFRMVVEGEYGARGKENIEPRFYQKKKLFVSFRSSLWASEVWLNREHLKKKLNETLGFQGIDEIKVSMN